MAKNDDKTKPYKITYKGSVTPKATKFLKSEPITMDFDGTIELDSTDAANIKVIQKEFQSEMESRIKSQADQLNRWLADKEQLIDDMVKRYESMKKIGFPNSPQEATQRAKTMKELEKVAKDIEDFPKDYVKIVGDWASNCHDQQGLIAMQLAVKSARVKTFDNKSWRVRAGQIVKAVLVVAAIAVSIAAIIVSAGATAPLFIGLASAGAALAGISNLGQLGKSLSENANMEKRLLANLQKDVEAIQNALGNVKDKNTAVAKHVTEMRNLIKVREDKIDELQNEVTKHTVTANSYSTELAKISGDKSVDASEVAQKKKASGEVSTRLNEAKAKIGMLKADNVKAREVIKNLADLGVDLDKVTGQSANTILGNLKERFSKVEGWTDLGNTVGGLVNSASGIHS